MGVPKRAAKEERKSGAIGVRKKPSRPEPKQADELPPELLAEIYNQDMDGIDASQFSNPR